MATRTMDRKTRGTVGRTIRMRPGDRFIANGVRYVVPSVQILKDIRDFDEEVGDRPRYSSVEEMFSALDAE